MIVMNEEQQRLHTLMDEAKLLRAKIVDLKLDYDIINRKIIRMHAKGIYIPGTRGGRIIHQVNLYNKIRR